MRRLAALIVGLPPEAVTWRKDGFTLTDEMLALIVERARPDITIRRPGAAEQERPRRKVEKDPKRIMQFFANTG